MSHVNTPIYSCLFKLLVRWYSYNAVLEVWVSFLDDKASYWTLCFSKSLPIPADGRRVEGDEAKEDDIKKSVGLFLYILFT